MTHGQYHLLIDGRCDCLLYQQGACGPGATSCGWAWALWTNSFFCEASQENSHNARARMLRAEGIRVRWSKEASFFRRFKRIPCVDFLPSVRNVVWFSTTYCFKIAEQRLFGINLCQLSYAWTILGQILQRISSDRYHS